jgi:hypothetical protein
MRLYVSFMSMGLDNVTELRPATGLLFFSQMIYEYGATVESYWWGNQRTQGKLKNSEKNLSQYHFVHHKSQWLTWVQSPASVVRGRQLTASLCVCVCVCACMYVCKCVTAQTGEKHEWDAWKNQYICPVC